MKIYFIQDGKTHPPIDDPLIPDLVMGLQSEEEIDTGTKPRRENCL
jgi:hypothetical protein